VSGLLLLPGLHLALKFVLGFGGYGGSHSSDKMSPGAVALPWSCCSVSAGWQLQGISRLEKESWLFAVRQEQSQLLALTCLL